MFKSAQESENSVLSLSSELLDYYDQFAEFSDQCAFLCDAYASIAANSEVIDQQSARGLEHSTDWLKYRVGSLKEALKKIHERASTEVS